MKKENIESLQIIFANVNDWLKFAEAKNALLLGLLGTAIVTISKVFSDYSITSKLFCIYLISFATLISVGIIILLFSFLPQTKMPLLSNNNSSPENDLNIFFYGHLATISPNDLLINIFGNGVERSDDYKFKINLAEQIITNSKITLRKYNYFRITLWFVISAVLTPFIGMFLYVTLDPHTKISLMK